MSLNLHLTLTHSWQMARWEVFLYEELVLIPWYQVIDLSFFHTGIYDTLSLSRGSP